MTRPFSPSQMVKTRGSTYSHLMVAHDRNQYYLGQREASYPSSGSSSSDSREVVSRTRTGQGAPNHPCTETGTQGAGVPSLARGTTVLSMDSKKGNPNQNIYLMEEAQQLVLYFLAFLMEGAQPNAYKSDWLLQSFYHSSISQTQKTQPPTTPETETRETKQQQHE